MDESALPRRSRPSPVPALVRRILHVYRKIWKEGSIICSTGSVNHLLVARKTDPIDSRPLRHPVHLDAQGRQFANCVEGAN
jgi:hypothetical protein